MPLRKFYNYISYALAALALLLAAYLLLFRPALFQSRFTMDEKTILTRIEKIGNLSVVKMSFQSVLDPTLRHSFFGFFDIPFVESKALLVIRTEAEGCIDFAKIKKENIIFSEQDVKIILPKPYVCHSRINLNESKTYDVNLVAKVFNPDLPDTARQEAEKNIANEAVKMGILDLASENARILLTPLFSEIANKTVTIEFEQ